MLKKSLYLLAVSMLAIGLYSCTEDTTEDNTEVETPEPEPEEPEEPEATVVPELDKMLWIDSTSNAQRFSSKANIRYFLDLIKETGFNHVVLDLRTGTGQVLYESDYLDFVTDIDGSPVTIDFDYLAYFIEQTKERDMKITVSTPSFPMGSTSLKKGPAYDNPDLAGMTCVQYTPDGLIDIKDDDTKVGAFLNPLLPEVQDYTLMLLEELLTKYDFDGYTLDYCRFCDAESDFSAASQEAFETYLGVKIANFPEDIFTYDDSGNRVAGTYYKEWWAFRAYIISDYVAKVRETIDRVKPEVELHYWAASWWHAIYVNGQNWGSPDYNIMTAYGGWNWASTEYGLAGYANQLDVFQLGAYLDVVNGAGDSSSIEYAIIRAKEILNDDCKMYGSFDIASDSFDVEEATYLCMMETDGIMIFELIYAIKYDYWDEMKAGIDRAEAELGTTY